MARDVALLEREGAWTNLAQTARLLGVDRSTLSKHAQAGHVHCVKVGLGRGQLVVPPREVLRLARVYRRVPIQEVQQKLAHEVAVHTFSDEEAVMHALEQLQGRNEWTEGESAARAVDQAAAAPVINLGRLRPRRAREEDVPAAGFLEAIDRRHPRQPQIRVTDPNPPVIDLGRLRPGRRL